MQRTLSSELLDSDAGTPREIEQSLTDICFVNRWFGGVSTTASMVRSVTARMGQKRISLLDVAGGRGDLPEMTKRRLSPEGIDLTISVLDRQVSHLPDRKGAGRRGVGSHTVVADALALPFRDSSFDVVSCSLFAHHLSPEKLICFVNEGLRVCRTAVLINDLVRSQVHLALVYLSLPLYNSRLTHYDAPASVRQAYRPKELTHLLQSSRAARIHMRSYHLYRMGVTVWKC